MTEHNNENAAQRAGAFAPSASILKDTIAEMTYPEVAAAIERGAIGLWGHGVVEQHGPHLPTGTDIYIPSARLRVVKHLLAQEGIEALIIPPFYWGVNHVSSSFPATIKVRPEVMKGLIQDVMKSLADDGLRGLYCISGHNDRAHNETLFEAICEAAAANTMDTAFIAETAIVRRLDIELTHPNVLPYQPLHNGPVSLYLDVHAGDWETSAMLAFNPEVVRADIAKALQPTNLVLSDLNEWRKGCEHAQRVTPLGYFGDPAAATPEQGRNWILREAEVIVQAIKHRLG